MLIVKSTEGKSILCTRMLGFNTRARGKISCHQHQRFPLSGEWRPRPARAMLGCREELVKKWKG